MKSNQLRQMVFACVVAAMYVALTIMLAPISFGNLQIRVAEVLVVLPMIFPSMLSGITLGCFLANLLGAMMGVNLLGYLDCFVGTLATYLALKLAIQCSSIKAFQIPILSLCMPVVMNGLLIGAELAWVLSPTHWMLGWFIFGLEVALGELIVLFVFGIPLFKAIEQLNLKERFRLS